ncbi:MAG: S8 family serine peptidase, partial [Candidatus Eisenbacteria bacterium]|nr:S8 family serine peptidase [Candidatus Eisenbacteria bacterium]
ERLGVAAVDRAAAALGAWFEPEFRGETPPSAGSAEPDFTAFYLAHLPVGADFEGALARLRALAEVASADPIAILPVEAVPDDSLWSVSYWYYTPARHDIHAVEAWDVTTGDTSIVVGVVDTGLIPYHPDLGGRVAGLAGNVWTNWVEKPGTASQDLDGNGYAHDTWGWDFVNLAGAVGADSLAYEDYHVPDNDPNDYAGHGTAVAGLVGALTNNAIGAAGTAWKVRIMPLRIGWATSSAPLGLVDMSFAAQAIRYATRMGAKVINCSFSSLNLSGLDAAVAAATHAGIVVVAAAGNSGQSHYLGDREDVISVAATNISDVVPSFSNRGAYVDLAAPGVNIFSTYITRTTMDSLGRRQPAYPLPGYQLDGTSFSAPLVAGAAALMQARRGAQGLWPLTPMGALLRLRETTDDIAPYNTGTGYGTGRLNVYRALSDPPTSTAWRGGARTVGPAVVLPRVAASPTLAYLSNDSKLVIVDPLAGDTLASAALPGLPAKQLAAADLGGGRGMGLFAGTLNGKLAGFDAGGAPLPGWPVTGPGGIFALGGGPALGDLDGDGVLEVVCGGDDGNVWAWSAAGTVLAGFPVMTSSAGIGAPVALSDLDSLPGVEIVAATRDGELHALRGDGSELAGWPVAVSPSPTAPVVTRYGGGPEVLIAAGGQLFAVRPDGSQRLTAPLQGTVAQDLALGDFDGDGADDVVIAVASFNEIQVMDSTGANLVALGWPFALAAAAAGPPVVGHVAAGGRPGVLVMTGAGLLALSDSAAALASFPKPGGAGTAPTLVELDGDGATEVAAGAGPDSSLYVYDAGPSTWGSAPQGWPTPRGNFARTGSRLYAPALDAVAPAAITDLQAQPIAPDSVALTWSATGDDSASGRATSYELRVAMLRSAAGSFESGSPVAGLPAPQPAGSPERFVLGGLAPNTSASFVIRARDEVGNAGPPSNVAAVTTPLGNALLVSDLGVVAASDSSVTLRWTMPERAGLELAAGPRAEAVESAPLARAVAGAPGRPATFELGGLARGTRYWFALRARRADGTVRVSNLAAGRTAGLAAGPGGLAVASRVQPSRLPVLLDWRGVEDGVARAAVLRLYDLSGRLVRTLRPGLAAAGTAQWNGRDESGSLVPAGLYFARLSCGSIHAQTRVVLLP